MLSSVTANANQTLHFLLLQLHIKIITDFNQVVGLRAFSSKVSSYHYGFPMSAH